LLGQGNDEALSATFKKLDYDHNTIKFTKVSMLTKHALALTSEGELYGWGSNTDHRLGLDGVPNATKPTPIARFNDKSIFQLIDVEAGDDHSFVHLMETFKDTGMIR
jgi:alpha-tubulin suppressor-like RCC1 family protein